MSKKIVAGLALTGLCALSFFLLNCGSSSSRSSGLLYVLTQGSGGTGNNVTSFAINLNSGNLSQINSNASTCTTLNNTPPISCGLPLDIVLDPTGATAFVLNQGVPCQHNGPTCIPAGGSPTVSAPPTIYSYTVNSDGSLSAPGTPITLSHPFDSSDTQDDADIAKTMIRDASGKFMFVINQGSSPPPGFPSPTQGNPSCPHDPQPGVNFDACPSISVFTMQPGSTTLSLVGKPFRLSKIPTALATITFTPQGSGTAQELLFVTAIQDICTQGCNPLHNDNTVSVYSVGSDGSLTEQPNSPYSTNTNPLSALAVNANLAQQNLGGVFLYVGSQPSGAGAVNVFELCTVVDANCTQADVNNTRLVAVGTPASVGKDPVAMVVDPTNSFLYVLSEGQNQVAGFRINTTAGTLNPLTPATQPTGSNPVSLAMHSTGKFLFVSNTSSSNISSFTVSTTTGAMSNPISVTSPPGPTGLASR